MNPVAFTLGKFSIKWYSLFILAGAFIGIFLFDREGKKHKVNGDFLFNMAFWAIIIGIIGARAYYVIFNYNLYKGDVWSIFKIWEGGLAIHGGIIAGMITLWIYSKKYGMRVIRIFDYAAPAVIIAQAIGRWGNFFNGEAHGMATTLDHLHSLHIPEFVIKGMNLGGIYYEPTFFYESLGCLVGFIVLLIIRRLKYTKVGNVTSFYLVYYGILRFFIESLRTDSLMIGGFKVAQVVSVLAIVIGVSLLIKSSRKSRFEDLYSSEIDKSFHY